MHFNQPDHSNVSMRVVIIEKSYHPTNNPTLSTHFRRQREEFWIKTLGTASSYGCNDNISSIGNLTSLSCSNTNVMTVFPSLSRRNGHRHYTPARLNEVSFDDLLPLINEPLGLHHIRPKLCSIPLVSMHKLRDKCLNSTNFDQSSNEYKRNSIILDIANCRMFLPVKSDFSNVSTDKL